LYARDGKDVSGYSRQIQTRMDRIDRIKGIDSFVHFFIDSINRCINE
jgi:hypothetical protein